MCASSTPTCNNLFYRYTPVELGWAEDEAHRIVRANQDRVQRLSGVLLERIELTDAKGIRDIIEGR